HARRGDARASPGARRGAWARSFRSPWSCRPSRPPSSHFEATNRGALAERAEERDARRDRPRRAVFEVDTTLRIAFELAQDDPPHGHGMLVVPLDVDLEER